MQSEKKSNCTISLQKNRTYIIHYVERNRTFANVTYLVTNLEFMDLFFILLVTEYMYCVAY